MHSCSFPSGPVAWRCSVCRSPVRQFSRFSRSAYPLGTDAFCLLSRRAINRVHAMSRTIPYRKALYASCGLKLQRVTYQPLPGVRRGVSAARERLRGVEITAMCDIDNPMYGENGAAYVFAPQKGAGPEQVRALDAGLRRLAGVMRRELGMDFAELPGAGAAGAMGAGVTAFLGASLQSGKESVLNAVDFDRAAADADLIFTGEGRLDSQSLRGKVVIGVARRAKRLGKRVIAIVGGAEGELEAAYAEGVTAVFTTNRLPEPLSRSAPRAAENLAFTMDNILRLL